MKSTDMKENMLARVRDSQNVAQHGFRSRKTEVASRVEMIMIPMNREPSENLTKKYFFIHRDLGKE